MFLKQFVGFSPICFEQHFVTYQLTITQVVMHSCMPSHACIFLIILF